MSKDEDDENEGSTFISLSEIADHIDASRSAVRGWLEEAGLKTYQFGSGKNSKLRYARADVEAWIDECGEDGEEEAEAEAEADDTETEDDDTEDDESESNPAESSDEDLEDDDLDEDEQ